MLNSGVGVAAGADAIVAVKEAISDAKTQLNGVSVTTALLFASSTYSQTDVLQTARVELGENVIIFGGSTAGEISERRLRVRTGCSRAHPTPDFTKGRQSASNLRLYQRQAIHCPASWAWSWHGGIDTAALHPGYTTLVGAQLVTRLCDQAIAQHPKGARTSSR